MRILAFLMVLLTASITANELDPAGMTQVMNGIDDSAYHVELGHTFPHLDKVFTDAWMSTNGFILLWSPTNNLGQQTLPSYGHCCDGYNFGAGTPNYLDSRVGQFSYMLAPLWTDLDDTNALKDDGYYYQTDTDRSRFLWYKVTEYNSPDALNTFQLNIDKSGGFEYIYDDVTIANHKVFVGWTGDTAADPYWHTQQFYGDSFTMSSTYANSTGAQLISNYGGDLASTQYSNGNFGLVGRADCTNPANDSTCDGYWDAMAQSSVTNQYTDNVFGDEVEDYFFTDNEGRQGQPQTTPPPQPYQNTSQEREMFGLAPSVNEPQTGEPSRPDEQRQQQQQQPEPIVRTEPERVERPVEAAEEPVQVVREPRREPRPDRVVVRQEPVEVERVQREERVEIVPEPELEKEAEKVIEREVIRPAVDVVGIALSTVGQPTYRSSSEIPQQSQMTFQAQMTFQEQQEFSPNTDVYDVQVQTTQAVAQQAQQQKTNTITTSDALAPASQMQFENNFNDAIATGQSVGQFLSAQLPDFSRFDVAPPSQDEQRTVQRAETQLQRMSKQAVQQNTEDQLEEVQDAGGFVDQSLTVLLISNNPEFNQYSQAQMADKQFYQNKVIYAGNRTIDRPLILRSGSNTYNAMVDSQWQR